MTLFDYVTPMKAWGLPLSTPVPGSAAYFQCQSMCVPAADGTKQLAGACEREYLFTNNPLITSDGQRDQTLGATQELALNETGLEIWVKPLCCHKDPVP